MINTQFEINKSGLYKNCKYVKTAQKRGVGNKKEVCLFSL
jgi:hypothetical protein